MKGRSIIYSPEEMAWIETRKDWIISALHRAFCEAFQRDDVSLVNLHSLRKRRGWKTGRTGQFPKGSVPVNKGKRMPYHPNSAATRFHKGNLPHNTHYAGHERVSKDGYIEISVAETNPHTGFERRYVLKHKWAWELANGPVPNGYCLKCLGDKLNVDPSNWEAVPRALLPRLNGGRHKKSLPFDSAPADLRPIILATAKLAHRARTLKARSASMSKDCIHDT